MEILSPWHRGGHIKPSQLYFYDVQHTHGKTNNADSSNNNSNHESTDKRIKKFANIKNKTKLQRETSRNQSISCQRFTESS